MYPFKRLVKKQLGELLIERGIITKTQLGKALDVQKEKGGLLGQVLVVLGFTKEEEIAQALTVQYGFPYLPLQNYELSKEVVQLIPENVSKQYCLIAVDKIGGMDERFFMYFEDVDWARRFWKNGYSVAYFPLACILHLHQKSSDRFGALDVVLNKMTRMHIKSAFLYFLKYRFKTVHYV